MENKKQGLMSRIKSIQPGLVELLRLDRDRQERLLDYFQRKPDLRMELVESIYLGTAQTGQVPTRDEMVAVLVLLGNARPIDRVIGRLDRFSNEGWADLFDDEFFELLEAESLNLRRTGFFREGRTLVKVGAVAARMQDNNEWAVRLNERIMFELKKQISDQPFLKQSGW
jgi:hypothetical protein